MKVCLDGATPETLHQHVFISRVKPEMEKLGVSFVYAPEGADVILAVGVRDFQYADSGLPKAIRPVYLHPHANKSATASNEAMRRNYEKADLVIWQSRWFRDTYCRLMKFSPRAECVIHNALAVTEGPAHSGGVCQFCDPGSKLTMPIIGIVGPWDRPRKRVPDMVAIARQYAETRRVKFWVAGDVHAREGGDGVRVFGPVPRDQMPCFHRRCRVLLNLSYFDNCPNAVVEALALGRHVVCNNQSGAAELVGTDGGIVLDIDRPIDDFRPTREPPAFDAAPVFRALDRVLMELWPAFERHELRIEYAAKRYKGELERLANGHR